MTKKYLPQQCHSTELLALFFNSRIKDSFIQRTLLSFSAKMRADRLHSAKNANRAALAVEVLLAGFTLHAHYLELFPNSIVDLK
jgi:hypothetical protein